MVSGKPRAPRVLVVSFFYPPFNSIGGLRISKMTRYLEELGWDVRVLTTDRDDVPEDLPLELSTERVMRARPRDVNWLPKRVLGRERVRARGFEVGSRLHPARTLGGLYRDLTNFPDGQIGWYRPALATAREQLRSWRPDVIFSSALPATSHLVARSLAREFRLPWVAEYRDPWTDSRSRRRAWPLYLAERRLEDRIVKDASALVAVSDAWADQLRRRFPGIVVSMIPNGFDAVDYTPGAAPPRGGPLLIRYTGRLYPRQDAGPFLRAVRWLIDAGVATADDLQVRFVGRYLGSATELARSLRLLGSVVTIDEAISHADALAAQQRAHVLLLLLGADEDIGWRPAKLYEYLGARRPILLTGGTARHEARELLLSSGAGVALDGADSIARQIGLWVAELRETGAVAYHGRADRIDGFTRGSLAAHLSDVLRSVADPSSLGAPPAEI